MEEFDFVKIGDKFYGRCDGYFNNEFSLSNEIREVEALGEDWIVVRNSNGFPDFCSFGWGDVENSRDIIVSWMVNPDADTPDKGAV